jgi:transposase InsO family protein
VHIRSDNGPELVSKVVRRWCAHAGTGSLFIEPGAPWQYGIVASFNGGLRDELLSSETFEPLPEAKHLVDQWRLHYNLRRPQRALGNVTPAAYAANCAAVPPLRLAPLACAASPQHSEFPVTISQLLQRVDR